MSVSVKNIAISIGDTNSNKFKMDIGGARYHFDNFKLEQKLMQPNRLTFTLFKDPKEDISEPQFSICSHLIGKRVELTLQTEATEKEISNANTEGQTADIEFEGFITQATSSRIESRQAILVEALSMDAALIDHPRCEIFNEEKLANIVKAIYDIAKLDTQQVSPEFDETIFYTGKYNENNYDFLRRMARRYSEWFYSTGKALHFGKISNSETVQLVYPSRDIPQYGVRLQTFHPNFSVIGLGYNTMLKAHDYGSENKEDTGNTLSDATFKASKDNYPHPTSQIGAATLESDSDIEKDNIEPPIFSQDQQSPMLRQRSNMLIYEGQTYCSRLKIGTRLNIKDNYLNSSDTNSKSEVSQDEILVTQVTHTFKANEQYTNQFKGITAAFPHPPYDDGPIHPVCLHPIMAEVVDTEDPKHWGRVKVRFPWQVGKYHRGHKNGTTPWIHVVQPYELNQGGIHLIPEKFSQVLIDFEEGNFERPQVIGTRFTSEETVDEKWYEGNDNHIKAIRTYSGHTIEVHDKSNGDEGGFIKIYDSKTLNYELTFDTDKKLIRLHSKGNIELRADRDIVMNAGRNMKINVGKPSDGYSLDEGDEGCFLLNVAYNHYNYVGFQQKTKAEMLSMLTTRRRRVESPYYQLDAQEYYIKVHPEGLDNMGCSITADTSELEIKSDNALKVRSRLGEVTIKGSTNVNISASFETNITSTESVNISGTTSVTIKGLQVQLN